MGAFTWRVLLRRTRDIFLVGVIAYGIGVYQNRAFQPDYTRLKESAVQIVHLKSSGSGVVIAIRKLENGKWEHDILTAAHVVAGTATRDESGKVTWQPLTVRKWIFEDGKVVTSYDNEGVVVRVSVTLDLALVRMTSDTPIPAAVIAAAAPKEGDLVCAAGSPVGLPTVVDCGRVSIPKLPRPESEQLFTQASVLQWSGNSGGGVFNERYEIVGMTDAIVAQIPHLALLVHLDQIKEFLDEKEEKN